MKKKIKPFTRWQNRRSSRVIGAGAHQPSQDPDDHSVLIVHNFVDGEITSKPKFMEDSLSRLSTQTSTAGTITDCLHLLYGQMNEHIPSEVRSCMSSNIKEKVINSLIDDDISAISFEQMPATSDIKSSNLMEDTALATTNLGNVRMAAKQRMIENIRAVTCSQTKPQDDESTYVTLDVDEWEREFGGGCCFTKELHGIVMETGDAVYDWAGEPEDYLLGKHLVSVCTDDGVGKNKPDGKGTSLNLLPFHLLV